MHANICMCLGLNVLFVAIKETFIFMIQNINIIRLPELLEIKCTIPSSSCIPLISET